MAEPNTTNTSNNSVGENVSEIQSLTERVQDLQRSFDSWSVGYVWLVGFAVIIAAVVFFTQFMSIRIGKQLTQAQSDLAAAKDRQLASELKGKDEKIADTGERASVANQRAVEANKRTQELAVEAQELRRQNIETGAELERERLVRLEMEKSLSPRIFVLEQYKDGKSNIDPLIKFKGTKVVIRYLADAESTRAKNELSNLLMAAGWDIVGEIRDPEMWAGFFDGVIVQTSLRSVSGRSERDMSRNAAEALLALLHSNGWTVRSHAMADDIPAQSIKVSIGFKPSPYFSPKLKEGVSQWYGNVGLYPHIHENKPKNDNDSN
ncbi:MAG: hypothetical protein IH628_03100 [Proteobacteria bacterium]|nr:hypothetical protein [Pseudomonadota bacterium]